MAKIDLISLTENDPKDEGTFECCVCCGSTDVTDMALFVSAIAAIPTVERTAWCADSECQDDREAAAPRSIAVRWSETGRFVLADTPGI